MRAIHCLDFGEPPHLALADVPQPVLKPGHARVHVEYCGVGFPEALILAGKYQVKPSLPFIPGSEIAGIVTEVAPDVGHVRVGSRVAGLNYTFTGGLAEEIVAPVAAMTELPSFVSTLAAAGILVNYATAYHALVQRGGLRLGEVALVLGAAGGVGLACLDIARACGATVLAACGSREKADVAERHGAETAFVYGDTPIKPEIMRLTEGQGVDVVVDPVGGAYTEQAFRCLKPGGRLLVIGFASGEIARIPVNLTLLKSCSIVGVSLGALVVHDPAGLQENLAALFRLYAQGLLRPELVETDAFKDYAAVFAALHRRERVGKIVMRIGNGAAG